MLVSAEVNGDLALSTHQERFSPSLGGFGGRQLMHPIKDS